MSKATTNKLGELHGAVANALTERILSGEASAADFGAAIKFLKDNAITADVGDNDHLKQLQEAVEQRARRREARGLKVVNGGLSQDEEDEVINGSS